MSELKELRTEKKMTQQEVADITEKCTKMLSQYGVNFCYLFGSYAKGKEFKFC